MIAENKGEGPKELAFEIFQNYIYPSSVVKEIPKETRSLLLEKSENKQCNFDKHLFDNVYGIAVNLLQEFFIRFQQSSLFQHLKEKLAEDEKIYERLTYAKLI